MIVGLLHSIYMEEGDAYPDLFMISERHRSIILVMNSSYLGWGLGHAYHRYCVRHIASNFFSKFHDKSLKMLLVRTAYGWQLCKFEHHMERVPRISLEAHGWLRSIPLEKRNLSHDGENRYGLTTTNFFEVLIVLWKQPETSPPQHVYIWPSTDWMDFRPLTKATSARFSGGGPYPTQISSKLGSYGIRSSKQVEVKTC